MNTDLDAVYFGSADEWRAWLAEHGSTHSEIWLGLYKKGATASGISYLESVQEALCFGWIDGLTKRVDEASYKIRFTPRKPRSNWSETNIKRVEALIENGKMTPAGLRHVDAAKADGRWFS